MTNPANSFTKVDYLIFELADGDVRSHLDAMPAFDAAFLLRTLHHVATGLQQLHRAQIAHQDLNPRTSSYTGGRPVQNSATLAGHGQATRAARTTTINMPVTGTMCLRNCFTAKFRTTSAYVGLVAIYTILAG